jgi:hypothetical protein
MTSSSLDPASSILHAVRPAVTVVLESLKLIPAFLMSIRKLLLSSA